MKTIEPRLGYFYAEIDDATNMCLGVLNSSNPDATGPTGSGSTYIRIPVYDENYVLKYYIDGNWYEDAAGTIPWTSSLI